MELQTLLDMGIIRPSKSRWQSPVVCVAKPDGSLYFCIDYRALNSVTHTDSYTMPRVKKLIDAAAFATFISTLDLAIRFLWLFRRPLSSP